MRSQGLSHHFDLHTRVLFKLTPAFYSQALHCQHANRLIYPPPILSSLTEPRKKVNSTLSALQTLNLVLKVAYWRASTNKALQRGWLRIKWPVLWKLPLKMTMLFPMGRVTSPVRAPPPALHPQETKRSEYFLDILLSFFIIVKICILKSN